ncbi:ABC-2 type transport system ATP-binding protein [Kibdelosporangium banguiense]|uniref:ABC-2 type transport system ATP-binding protein n=1 Tax=Kibdelosporangium banguiense TaxID=1365924 RepID=A0ABS4TSL1_9PSEU|nr:ABC transporter ATP-binding protein [Kibdelosporangium banguiense]MBP2327397.1 ABC-2 type transport system ATP-binding protein [Kibdelosporangium banguiense]
MRLDSGIALEAAGLGKQYRRGWALRDCTFELPAGSISALVGPNGAGKSTLMHLANGLLTPTTGHVRAHQKVAFLAQDKPLYRRFTVAEMLRAGESMNPDWDNGYATKLVEEADVPMHARVGTLSGGQRTRVALAIALGRRPQLIMLDEPLSDLDPLARTEVMKALMAEAADTGMTVLLSSHVLADLESVCDHLVLLAGGRIHLCGDVEDLLSQHRIMIGPSDLALPSSIVDSSTTARQATLLARATHAEAGWELHEPSLEELALGYLRSAKENKDVAA